VLFVGDDWAEDHHDVELVDDTGRRLARARLGEGVDGIRRLHELTAAHTPQDAEPDQVVVGIETDRGPWVQALLAAGDQVSAMCLRSTRSRSPATANGSQRHSTSGAKSDAGDAHVLAELVRLDRAAHRPVAGDSELAEAVKLLASCSPAPTRAWSRAWSGTDSGTCCACGARWGSAFGSASPPRWQPSTTWPPPRRWSYWPPRRTRRPRPGCRVRGSGVR
jgi:Transposase